jgi:uncharacterized membrane protein YeiH
MGQLAGRLVSISPGEAEIFRMDASRFEGVRLGVEAAAMVAFAFSGLMEAARHKLDLVGACAVAFVTSFGGGTLRDLLLDQRPFFWVQHTEYVWMLLVVCILGMMLMTARHRELTERAILLPDALGLGLFVASSVKQAHSLGYPALIVALMGVLAGAAGGALRDIACNEVPQVFRDKRPYAVIAFAGGWYYMGLIQAGYAEDSALLLTAAAVAGLRGLALLRNWQLPDWRM